MQGRSANGGLCGYKCKCLMRILTEIQIQFRCLISAKDDHLYRNASQIEVCVGTARRTCLMRVLIEMQI